MLIQWSDKERAFDLAIQHSFPYLIFPPIGDTYNGLDYDEFRNMLINNLVALYHYKNGNDDITFYKQNEEINNMLETAVFDKVTSSEIESYKYQQMTIDKAIRELAKKQQGFEERLKHLEHINKQSNEAVESKNIEDHIITNNTNRSTSSKKSYIDRVYEILETNPNIVYTEIELADLAGLSQRQVKNAFTNMLYNRPPRHPDKIPHIVKGTTKYKPNPDIREYPLNTYKWVETSEQELNQENII